MSQVSLSVSKNETRDSGGAESRAHGRKKTTVSSPHESGHSWGHMHTGLGTAPRCRPCLRPSIAFILMGLVNTSVVNILQVLKDSGLEFWKP